MLAGIKRILIIVNKGQLNQFRKILPEKNNLGISLEYKEQTKPAGLPEAFTIGEKLLKKKCFTYLAIIFSMVKVLLNFKEKY